MSESLSNLDGSSSESSLKSVFVNIVGMFIQCIVCVLANVSAVAFFLLTGAVVVDASSFAATLKKFSNGWRFVCLE